MASPGELQEPAADRKITTAARQSTSSHDLLYLFKAANTECHKLELKVGDAVHLTLYFWIL